MDEYSDDDMGFFDTPTYSNGEYSDVNGFTTYTFDDGSTLTVNNQGDVVDATDTEGQQITGDYTGQVNTNGTPPVAQKPVSSPSTNTKPTATTNTTGNIPGNGIGTAIANAIKPITNTIGNAVSNISPATYMAGLGALLTPDILNRFTGGLYDQAHGNITAATSNIGNVQGANLQNLIPQLQQAVMQGQMKPEEAYIHQAVMQGQMTPEQGQVALQDPSLMMNVMSDAQSLTGQRQALARLQAMYEGGGMTEADRAQLAATMAQTNANAAQQRQAQIQQLQMQGNAGTGAELAARLMGTQSAANANALAGANVAQGAQARALQALQANLQGNANLNQQLFEQDAARARAQDAINQYNTGARNQMTAMNTANRQNAAMANFQMGNQMAMQNAQMANQLSQSNAANRQASNLANFQMANAIGNKNVDIANQQAMLPLQVGQQSFQNALNQAQQYANANLTGANILNRQANTYAQTAGNMFTGLTNLFNKTPGQHTTTGSTPFATTNQTIPTPAPTQAPTIPTDDNENDNQYAGTDAWGDPIRGNTKEKQVNPVNNDDMDEMFGRMTNNRYRWNKGA